MSTSERDEAQWKCAGNNAGWLGYTLHVHCYDQLCLPVQQCSVRFDARHLADAVLKGAIAMLTMTMVLAVFVVIFFQIQTSQCGAGGLGTFGMGP
jgi:hypothetical protein